MEISIIIPVYNKEAYVRKCIRSTLVQSFGDYEIIIVDDGSSDNSGKICDELAEEYDRIKVFHIANGGVTAARRYGVEHAQGRYITFVDSDDELLPDGLSILHQAMLNSNADEIISTYNNQYGINVSSSRTGFQNCEVLTKELLSSRARFCVLWAVLFKKELLDGCLDTPAQIKSGEDIMVQIMCLMKNPKVFFIKEATYMYNAGLPNERGLNLEDEMLYDKVLEKAINPHWDTYKNFFLRHQIKMYENFVNQRKFFAYKSYYRNLRKDLNKDIPLKDRIALLLPPLLSYFPIRIFKQWLALTNNGSTRSHCISKDMQ